MSEQSHKQSDRTLFPLPPTIPDIHQWPLNILSLEKESFLEEVIENTKAAVLKNIDSPIAMYNMLASVLYQERIRITQTPWKADPPDEKDFWNSVRSELLKAQKESRYDNPDYDYKKDPLLHKILDRYAHEIVGHFNPKVFNFAQKFLPFIFSRLLNSRPGHFIKSFWSKKAAFHEKFKITGDIEILRKLSLEGTIVVVPTHFSNLDSPVIGWAVESCGLPAVIYGAGLNLLSVQPVTYLINNLGAYKLDRRKKNEIYLELLKVYSQIALQRGTHSLFFPGGTRSRSGALENKLKLGLLSTAIEAQQHNVKSKGKKIFIVPVVLNYNFVLEAPSLINQHLKQVGKEKFVVDNFEYSTTYKLLKFIYKFFTANTDLTVSFGTPMDIIGNNVNERGESINHLGEKVEIEDYFKTNGTLTNNAQRNFEYTKILGEKIVQSYFKFNTVLTSHLVPFTAFQILKKKYPNLDLYGLLRLPMEDTQIEFGEFAIALEKVRTKILEMRNRGELKISEEIELPLEALLKHGMSNLGLYHAKKVLFIDTNGNYNTEDMKLLFFYHNRLEGYKLEQYV